MLCLDQGWLLTTGLPSLSMLLARELQENFQTCMLSLAERTDFHCFGKIMVLIKDNCQLRLKIKTDLEKHSIFYMGDIFFKTDKPQPIKQAVYWIYKSAEDEESKENDAQKILVLFDFPIFFKVPWERIEAMMTKRCPG